MGVGAKITTDHQPVMKMKEVRLVKFIIRYRPVMQKLSLLTTRNFSRKEYIHNLCGMWTNQFIQSYTMSSLSLLYCYNTLMVMIVIIYKLDLIIFVVVVVHHYFHHRWSETIFLVDTRNPMYKLYLHSLIGKVGRDKHCRRLCRMSSNSSSWQFFFCL